MKEQDNETKISTQNEVMDFPKQEVITRDNAFIQLDALLNYQVVNPKAMIYSTQNLPRMLAKLLQAQLRNVAGTLDVDQVIESTAGLSRVGSEMQRLSNRWGVHVKFVKIQNVNAGQLRDVLQRKKNADLSNKEVLISAKAEKQKMITRAEGERDSMQNQAQGESQAERARARGDAKAIINSARAEAESVREVARAISRSGENPTKYLLALKYIKALQKIMWQNGTSIRLLPNQTAFLQTIQGMDAVHVLDLCYIFFTLSVLSICLCLQVSDSILSCQPLLQSRQTPQCT